MAADSSTLERKNEVLDEKQRGSVGKKKGFHPPWETGENAEMGKERLAPSRVREQHNRGRQKRLGGVSIHSHSL